VTIPESDGNDVIVGVQLEASGRVGQPSTIETWSRPRTTVLQPPVPRSPV
jgi:hypothetical protein